MTPELLRRLADEAVAEASEAAAAQGYFSALVELLARPRPHALGA